MLYDTSNPLDKRKFLMRAQALADKGAIAELKEKTPRSLNANAYLHLLIGIVASEFGTSPDDAKATYFKTLVNPDLFVRVRKDKALGRDRRYLRSTRELDKEEMSIAIDRFKKWAAEQSIYLPEPEDKILLAMAEVELSKIQPFIY